MSSFHLSPLILPISTERLPSGAGILITELIIIGCLEGTEGDINPEETLCAPLAFSCLSCVM